ncbi:HNH endonuclease [Argonema galeatum]
MKLPIAFLPKRLYGKVKRGKDKKPNNLNLLCTSCNKPKHS